MRCPDRDPGAGFAVARRMSPVELSEVTGRVIGAAISVHRALGPGLLESTYRHCLAHEFDYRGIGFASEVAVPVIYRETRLDCGYRVDFVVESEVVVEIKSVERLTPVHQAQVMTYLKLMNLKRALLLNFNVTVLKDGLKSFLRSS
ncbi:MAG TPA: GxxExxY protein [Vicinamibacterales bacterium]|nr:GxxExxY protein [Vicinamibacterales bacterium]